jgi:hypothetical protein
MTDANLGSGERHKLWLYFLDLRLRYAVAILFLGLILAEFCLGKVLLLAAMVWLGAALVLATQRPSDQEIDELLSRDLKSLVDKALHSLSPAEHEMQAPPFALFGPVTPAPGARDRRFTRPRRGSDGRPRSPINQAVILLPMEDQLGIYTCDHDSLNGLTSQVSVEEHHYRDVVSVRLEKGVEVSTLPALPTRRPDRGGGRPATQVFSLDLTSGRHLSVPVMLAWQEELPGGAEPQPTDLEKTVLAIRALMRDKR